MFKFKITPHRHNAGQKLNYCLLPDPPLFSLPSTFNPIVRRLVKDIETGEDLAVKLEPQLAKEEFNSFSVTFKLLF